MYDSKLLSAEAQQVGAHGYVLKSQAARDLIAAIETLLAGGTFFGVRESEAEPQQETPSRPRVAYRSDLGFSPA
jgi:DNA-binding NarL/FixJ family response regulator